MVGAEQLPAVRHRGEAGVAGDPEGGRELARVPAPLVVAEPEPHHLADAVAGIARGQAGEGPGFQRVSHPGRRDDDADLVAGDLAGLPRRVEDDLDRGGDAADERSVRGGVCLLYTSD